MWRLSDAGIELREHVDALETGVKAVADRDIDQPPLSADWHRGLRSLVGQREQPRAAAAAQDDGQNVIHLVFILWHRSTGSPCPLQIVHALGERHVGAKRRERAEEQRAIAFARECG